MFYHHGFNMFNFFNIFNLAFFFIFALVCFLILSNVFKNVKENKYNDVQPILDIFCKVVAKRMDVTNHNHVNDDINHRNSSTRYYVTFEFESKDRLELQVKGNEYGMMIENDEGKLKFQGTRFLGFNRI